MSYKRKLNSSSYQKSKRTHTDDAHSSSFRPIEYFKKDLHSYLTEHANIIDQNDFWRFYEKYKAHGNSNSFKNEVSSALNISFEKDNRAMYEKCPLITTSDKWLPFDYTDFKNFLMGIKVYQDFQQKTSFNKLKKLKTGQNDLPIAKYKQEIMESIKKYKVLLIAGEFYWYKF